MGSTVENGCEVLQYVVVTPCRDECEYLGRMAESLAAQTVRPEQWVLVDDGSSDGTSELADELADGFPWMRVIHRDDRGDRSVGGGVVEAFAAGQDRLSVSDYDVICKLDADIVLPPDYMERMLERMDRDPRLGSCSGKAYFVNGAGELVSEHIGDDVSVGASKVYRARALAEIGGLVPAVMWDGIDVHELRRRGWRVGSWDEPELRFVHLRPMGSSDRGIVRGRVRGGAGQYFMGTGPLWMLASGTYRMFRPPLVIGGLAMIYGYTLAWLRRSPRYGDREFRRYLHRFHRLSLVVGKARARARIERELEPLWVETHSDESEVRLR